MILTKAQYDLETGCTYIYKFDVVEKPHIYTDGKRNFTKSEEEYVRYLKGSYNSPYLEVYTLNTENPVETLQLHISNWLKERASLVPFKIYENRILRKYDIEMVRKYMESINLEDYGVEIDDFPSDEQVQDIYNKLSNLQNPRFWDLQAFVAVLLKELQQEIQYPEYE